MSDDDRIGEAKSVNDSIEVGGDGGEVVAFVGLEGQSMASLVEGDYAKFAQRELARPDPRCGNSMRVRVPAQQAGRFRPSLGSEASCRL